MVELEKPGKVVTAVGYCYRGSPAIAANRDHIRTMSWANDDPPRPLLV